MRASNGYIGTTVAAALVFCAVSARGDVATGEPAFRHVTLVKAEPAANDTLSASPDSVHLWFSESVQLPVTRIRVTRSGHTPRLSAPVVKVVSGAETVVVAIKDPLAAGTYRVIWKTAGPDGHPTTGVYSFVVRKGG